MRRIEGRWIVSATDLSTFYTCDFKFELARQVATGERPRPEVSPVMEVIREHGLAHEKRVLQSFGATHNVVELNHRSRSTVADMDADCAQTIQAMSTGADYIYQAALYTGDFYGIVDFLVLRRHDDGTPVIDSTTGKFVYEPLDAKSARSEKVAAIVQVTSYARALRELHLPVPSSVHLHLGNDRQWSGSALQLLPVVDQMMAHVRETLSGNAKAGEKQWGEKKAACEQCDWKKDCETGRRADRDLSIVQNLRSDARLKLHGAGITAIESLARAADQEKPERLARATFENLRAQAAVQLRSEASKDPVPAHEIRDTEALCSFPERSPGDIFFDIEGDPFANMGQGLEYLLGVVILDGSKPDEFKSWWADNPAEERQQFENFVDWVNKRIETYPDLHIYHYADYERAALLRLALRHDTRVNEVEDWLREGRLIDHYGTVRRGLRIGTESLSIKKIEALYGERHDDEEVATALDSVIQFEAYLGELTRGEMDAAAKRREDILSYNEKDCVSLRKLDTWLREYVAKQGLELVQKNAQDEQQRQSAEDPVVERLKAYFPEDPAERTDQHNWIALMAAAPGFHRREDKPTWWKIYDLASQDTEDWDGVENAYVVLRASPGEWRDPAGRETNFKREVRVKLDSNTAWRELKVKGDVKAVYDRTNPGRTEVAGFSRSFRAAKVISLSSEEIVLEESASPLHGTWMELPIGLINEMTYTATKITNRLIELATEIADRLDASEGEPFSTAAWADLLTGGKLRDPFVLHIDGEFEDQAISALLAHDEGCFAVQGPPGTGKTSNGARIVARLIKEHGWRVGICSQSHKTIEGFIDAVLAVDSSTPAVKVPPTDTDTPKSYHHTTPNAWISQQAEGFLVGGTAFALNNDKHSLATNLDLMIIDEAGQFSLANSLAVASHARRVLLLGDPQQLPQVSQGTHPAPIDASALVHWTGEHAVMPKPLGYFLDVSHRMHSRVCKVVSDLQYEGLLHSNPDADKRHLKEIAPGLHVVAVEHVGNRTSSPEEVEHIIDIVSDLIGRQWSDGKETSRALTAKDVLIVAPFNAQRRLIQQGLQERGLGDVQVGTVDKFQGQQAPVVIVSMTASSADELPRGLDFLLSPNRLNVAISRAQWAAFLVHSPELTRIHPTSPSGVAAFGAFLGVLAQGQA